MDQSHGAKPFRFATEFAVAPPGSTGDAHATALEVAALRAEIEALRADHAVALSKARSEGYMEALGQMRAEREQAVLAALDALHAEWEVFGEARDAMIEALRGEASALALSIGEALAAQALREAPGEAIDQAIGRVLSQIARGQAATQHLQGGKLHQHLAPVVHAHMKMRRQMVARVHGDGGLHEASERGHTPILVQWLHRFALTDGGRRQASAPVEPHARPVTWQRRHLAGPLAQHPMPAGCRRSRGPRLLNHRPAAAPAAAAG